MLPLVALVLGPFSALPSGSRAALQRPDRIVVSHVFVRHRDERRPGEIVADRSVTLTDRKAMREVVARLEKSLGPIKTIPRGVPSYRIVVKRGPRTVRFLLLFDARHAILEGDGFRSFPASLDGTSQAYFARIVGGR